MAFLSHFRAVLWGALLLYSSMMVGYFHYNHHAESVLHRQDFTQLNPNSMHVLAASLLPEKGSKEQPAMKDTFQDEILLATTPDENGLSRGILSHKPTSFFQKLQADVDAMSPQERCRRYGPTKIYNSSLNRRIFYGALMAGEPWELFEITAAESHAVFAGMVFVEGNRTQNLTPRNFTRLKEAGRLSELFGTTVQVRMFVDENPKLKGLAREHEQRAEVLKGWKELGMQPDDIGFLADTDEMFTRDFLRALQTCDGFDFTNYDLHHCHHSKVKMVGSTRVFETTPECITKQRYWHHPDAIIGHCIEGIGDETKNPIAPREGNTFFRAPGWGKDCDWSLEKTVTDNRYPLWNAADFRRTCGGHSESLVGTDEHNTTYDRASAFHFHNFFSDVNATRFKYKTYGHPDKHAYKKPLHHLSNDIHVMYDCVMEQSESDDQRWFRTDGGFTSIKPFLPIYFQDQDYRHRRHAHIRNMLEHDKELYKRLYGTKEDTVKSDSKK